MKQSHWLSCGQDFMVQTWFPWNNFSNLDPISFFASVAVIIIIKLLALGFRCFFFEVGCVEKVCSKKLASTKLISYHPDILRFKCAARKKRNMNFTFLRDHFGGYWTLVELWGPSCSWPILPHMGSGDNIIFYQYQGPW